MWNDEIVEEVRGAREEYAKKFNYDIAAICADIRRTQAESNRKIVSTEKHKTKDQEPDILKAV